MDAQKLAVPLLAFAGGAILARVLGLKTLVRGAMTAVALTGIATQPTTIGANGRQHAVTARRRKPRRSAKRSASSAPRSA